MPRKQIYSPVHIHNKNKMPDESSINSHCFKRMRIMITLGLLLRKIVEKKGLKEVKIDFDGAKIQDGRGNRQLKTEAAHNLPRNILINELSTWEYINDPECNFHDRTKKQLYLLSASTVIVKREINYIDSQWEKNGIMDVLIKYLYECINVNMNTDGEFELLLIAGKNLIDGCKMTFNETIEKIKKRKTYKNKNEIFDKAFEEYNNVIENFDYNYFIERFLDIYRLPQYK